MKYKVNDRVRVQSKEWYESHKNKFGKVWTVCLSGEGTICFDQDHAKYCGKVLTIAAIEPENYAMVGNSYAWTDEMIEGLVEEEIEFTEEDKYWCDIMSESDPTTYILPQGYQFVDENGNVINATKIVLEKKKKEYPKTYEECCEIVKVGKEHTLEGTTIRINYKIALLESFQKLLICRDAYWKIAGAEMGLGKPWKPNDSSGYCTYAILRHTGHIRKSRPHADSELLEFPTEELRDAFYENFKKEIEICKELL